MRVAAGAVGALVVAAGLLPGAGAVAAERETREPYELVRLLQDGQEQLARGTADAAAQQSALMGRISRRLAAAGPELWRDRRNLRAVVTYLLSGGPAQAIKSLPAADALDKDDNALLRGAYAYAAGRDGEALRLLGQVEPRSLPPALAGHVALIQASLGVSDDLPRIATLLDLARLAAPGTLVEEAALRREVGVVAQLGDFDKFVLLSRQYLDRFANSVYVANFVEVFVGAAVQTAVAPDGARFARLEPVFAQLRREVQRDVYLQIARAAAVKGAIAVARTAAERAEALADAGSLEASRARLYGAAALVATDRYEQAVQQLNGVERADFAQADAELRRAVAAVAARLRRWPDAGGAAVAAAAVQPVRAASAPPLPAAATIESAESALAAADALLQGAPP